MKAHGLALPSKAAFLLWLGFLLIVASNVQGAYYQPGQVVTNFVLYARSDQGESLRLKDFAGKIIFVEFFDPT